MTESIRLTKDSASEWTHHTFNPCTKVSGGCKNCHQLVISSAAYQFVQSSDTFPFFGECLPRIAQGLSTGETGTWPFTLLTPTIS
jgi:protein gp37